jgi:hypothetical protein
MTLIAVVPSNTTGFVAHPSTAIGMTKKVRNKAPPAMKTCAIMWAFIAPWGPARRQDGAVATRPSHHDGHRVAGDERHADHAVHHLDEPGV